MESVIQNVTSDKVDAPKIHLRKYTQLISTLPRVQRRHASYDMHKYQGFWYPTILLEGIMSVQEQFQAHPKDIVLCSAPKTGTTWLKALTFAITTRHHSDEQTTHLLTTTPHQCVPSLELDLVPKDQNPNSHTRDPKVPLFATHLPYTSLPGSIRASGCKIVYVCRDPKDTFVSLWYFTRKHEEREPDEAANDQHRAVVTPEEELELFCEGKTYYGPYWAHILGYWEASLKWPERVLFLKYEDMKSDTVGYIKRLAEFMCQPFSKEEEIDGVPQKIQELCKLQGLASFEVINNFQDARDGEGKNYFTAEMRMQVDELAKQKLHTKFWYYAQ